MSKTLDTRTESSFYSVAEVATIFGVHEATIRRKCEKGTIKAIKFGGVWRIYRSAVDRLRQQHPAA